MLRNQLGFLWSWSLAVPWETYRIVFSRITFKERDEIVLATPLRRQEKVATDAR